jgi:hypothetical protein
VQGVATTVGAESTQLAGWFRSEYLAWLTLSGLLIVALPLFICMPVWTDIAFFDACTRMILSGHLIFKELQVGPFAAGWIVIHAAVRALVGWSTEGLRCVDLAVVGMIIALLAARAVPDLSRTGRVWLAFFLALFYLSTSEWCHCQPDTWMLLPATAALCLRMRQTLAQLAGAPPNVFRRSLLEGAFWAIAFTIKPFAGLAAIVCLAVSGVMVWRAGRKGALRGLAFDLCGLLSGGMLVGLALLGWVYSSGNWPYFLTSARDAPGFEEYYLNTPAWEQRIQKLVNRLMPWNLINLVALPTALLILLRWATSPAPTGAARKTIVQHVLLAVAYLAWFTQENFIQHQLDYNMVPPLLMGIALLATQASLLQHRAVRWGFILAVVLLGLWNPPPLLSVHRLALWTRCWSEGSTAELRQRLGTLTKEDLTNPTWTDLHQVELFLKDRHAKDRDVTCWNCSTVHVLSDLGILPANRAIQVDAVLIYLPRRQGSIIQDIKAGPQRFVLVDMRFEFGLSMDDARRASGIPRKERYPSNLPVVFRAGRYLVHEVPPGFADSSPEVPNLSAGPPEPASLKEGPPLLRRLALLLVLMAVGSVGPGLFFVRRLRWNPSETLCASLGLSLLLIFALSLLIHLFRLPVGAHYVVTAALFGLVVVTRHDLFRLLRHAGVQQQLAAYALLLVMGLVMISVIRNFSGGTSVWDWLEQYRQARYFLDSAGVEKVLSDIHSGDQPVSFASRSSLLNAVAAHYMAQAGQDYPVFQIVVLFLSLLVYFPLDLMGRWFAGRQRFPRSLLVALLALNPVLWWNTTFTWTKVLASFYVILAVWFYLAACRKRDQFRMSAAFGCVCAAFLVDTYAAPYAVMLGLHYLLFVLPTREQRGREVLRIALASAILLCTWVPMSLATFHGRTDATHAEPGQTTSELSGQIAWNCIASIVPHPLRSSTAAVDESMHLSQPTLLGRVRDHYFLTLEGVCYASIGSVGGLLVLFLLVRDLRRPAPQGITRFWIFFLTGSALLGLALAPLPRLEGVWYLSGQPLTYLGVAYLAACFSSLPVFLRVAGILGCAFDALVGILLHFKLENLRISFQEDPERGMVCRTILSDWAMVNGREKFEAGLAFVGDYFRALAPFLLWCLLLLCSLVLVQLIRVSFHWNRRYQGTTQ